MENIILIGEAKKVGITFMCRHICVILHTRWRGDRIKLKKWTWLIACKKVNHVVVRFQFSEIGWLENSTFHSQWNNSKLPPKRWPGGRLHPPCPQCFWRGFSIRGHWKFILQMLAGVHLCGSTQLTVEGWVFKSADFWILESNDNINTFLTSY